METKHQTTKHNYLHKPKYIHLVRVAQFSAQGLHPSPVIQQQNIQTHNSKRIQKIKTQRIKVVCESHSTKFLILDMHKNGQE